MREIDPSELQIRPFHLLDKEWALLVGGKDKPNPMTVSWGGFGTLWEHPVVTVYVRPTRHTFGLLKEDPSFTLNILPEGHRKTLDFCGSESGREVNKWKACGIHPAPSSCVPVPRVSEAELAVECRVVATMQVDPGRFLDRSLEQLYPKRDYHTAFVGHVLTVWAADRFLRKAGA